MDQQAAITACQQGDMSRFTLLFDAYGKKIYDYIYYRTHHTQTAEDLSSQVFLKAMEHIRSFDPSQGSFSTWLYRIARNTVIDHYRTSKATEDIADVWEAAAPQNVERDADAALRLEQVRKFLVTLPPMQRDIIVMRVWDGLSHKEIAEIMGISEASSKMTFSRALARIGKQSFAVMALLLIFSR